MTWQRFWTSGYEDEYLGGIDATYSGSTFGYREAFFNDLPFTGTHSLNVVRITSYPVYYNPALSLRQQVQQVRVSLKAYISSFNNGFRILGIGYADSPSDDDPYIQWQLNTSGVWEINLEDTVIATISPYPSGFSMGEWQTYGIVAKAGVDGFVSFYHNGQLVYTHSGLIADSFNYIRLIGQDNAISTSRMDDIYVDIADGAEPDEVPFSYRFFPLQAKSVGSHNDWQVVDNGEDKILSANKKFKAMEMRSGFWTNAADDIQTFTTTNVRGHDNYAVNALCVRIVALAGPDIASPTIEAVLTDGVNQIASPPKPLTWAYDNLEHRFPLRPDGSAWTHDFSDMQFGFRS